jgi:hypothetical protein
LSLTGKYVKNRHSVAPCAPAVGASSIAAIPQAIAHCFVSRPMLILQVAGLRPSTSAMTSRDSGRATDAQKVMPDRAFALASDSRLAVMPLQSRKLPAI